MSDPPVEPRAVAALAEAIDAALDTWDDGRRPGWAMADPDRLALAEAIVSLLSQFGYTVSPIHPGPASAPSGAGGRRRGRGRER
jgi:hypothetical protein